MTEEIASGGDVMDMKTTSVYNKLSTTPESYKYSWDCPRAKILFVTCTKCGIKIGGIYGTGFCSTPSVHGILCVGCLHESIMKIKYECDEESKGA